MDTNWISDQPRWVTDEEWDDILSQQEAWEAWEGNAFAPAEALEWPEDWTPEADWEEFITTL